MQAPEKIYLTTDGDNSFVFTQKRSDNKGIEYTRTDAFVEKAAEWLKENIYKHVYKQGDDLGFPTAEFLKDFKKYMKD